MARDCRIPLRSARPTVRSCPRTRPLAHNRAGCPHRSTAPTASPTSTSWRTPWPAGSYPWSWSTGRGSSART